MNLLLFVVIAITSCNSHENNYHRKICNAIERDEIFVKGFMYLNDDNELVFDFKHGTDSVIATGYLIGCSEPVDESILKFYNENKNYSDNKKVTIGIWGVLLESKGPKRYDFIIEQLVAL